MVSSHRTSGLVLGSLATVMQRRNPSHQLKKAVLVAVAGRCVLQPPLLRDFNAHRQADPTELYDALIAACGGESDEAGYTGGTYVQSVGLIPYLYNYGFRNRNRGWSATNWNSSVCDDGEFIA